MLLQGQEIYHGRDCRTSPGERSSICELARITTVCMFIFLCVLVSYPLFPLLPQARGEPYRPTSSLSAPVTRFDGRPRARDRPKPRRRPRPKEPEESRRSRSAPATGAPTTPQPPSHTAQNEGPLYRKKATNSDLENQQRSPNRYKAHPPCGREYQSRRTLFLMMRSCQFSLY